MIDVNTKDFKQLEAELEKMAHRSLPFASRAALNGAAFAAQALARQNIEESMILRNRFTVSSVRVERAKGLDTRQQEATVGSIADFMARQESGGTSTGGGKSKPIATGYAAGQDQQRPRTKLPARRHKLANIRLQRQGRAGGSRARRNKVAVLQAAQTGSKYVYLDLQRGPGLFRVLGGKRRPRVRMVWDLSRRSVETPRNEWLAPAAAAAGEQLPELYADALRFQLARRGLLRGG